MYDPDIHSVRSGNYHTLTLTTPVAQGKEPGDYNKLFNKPSINGIELVGDTSIGELFDGVSLTEIGLPEDIVNAPTAPLSNEDLDSIIT